MKYIYVKDNLAKVRDRSKLILKVNGKEVWRSDNKISISFPEAKKYKLKLIKQRKIILEKEFTEEQLTNKYIYIVSRDAHPWTGLRGMLFSFFWKLFKGPYGIKLKKEKDK